MAHNLSLSLHYVPSHLNPAHQPSRVLSDLDCTLSQDRWKRIDTTFGPHTIDLMALPSNVRHNRSGNPLPFFSPFPCPQSAGTNVFAQSIARQENAYLFPPFLLTGPLFRFLESQSCTFTIIVPDISPRKYWWPLVFCRASCAYKLASKGFYSQQNQPLPEVPRVWKPAVQCSDCSYPNDTGFRFCQACGYKRKSLAPDDNPHLVSLDLPSLDLRLETLQAVNDHKPYQVQKSKLRKELESFLSSLPCPKTLLSASPRDVTRFLVWKDRKGKTKVHVPTCSLFGAKKAEVCSCPSNFAAGTVANLIGKLRSLFVESGRGGEWNDLLGIGNPASHHSVKQYLVLIREEQARARITPKQAVPLFFEFFAGDRASDLGRIFTKEVLTLPDDEGFLFKHTFGKTLRGKNSNTFMVKNAPTLQFVRSPICASTSNCVIS
ncbi:Protein LIGHT-DEPENDENT SHORT HYPOCOTYLS 6 [Acropora cervicornis]|uniref:Protein LIGHT-DEPENDENT SHORT HYPOCOTYLS 6 n=1 Tax=Acropora cervicornis TaxID=6130 RepID=A0AAD9Q1Q4_ACRCE|nr:Protein LIGHT-DEPENDENT SHORT HYPOCOTYLS 6 [Acropora cervicornis]